MGEIDVREQSMAGSSADTVGGRGEKHKPMRDLWPLGDERHPPGFRQYDPAVAFYPTCAPERILESQS